MKNTNVIYKIFARNKINTITFSTQTIDEEYKNVIFNNLKECIDVQYAFVMNSITGEIIDDYDAE